MSEEAVRIVFCSMPNLAEARQIGTVLVERQLAACVNLIPKVESIYRWKGRVERSDEVLAIFKTTVDRYPAFEAALVELHPYEVPEVLAVGVEAGLPSYLAWLGEVVSS
jgi:periplasmic divalent cation tolerance protein